jgi:hypothetical protein
VKLELLVRQEYRTHLRLRVYLLLALAVGGVVAVSLFLAGLEEREDFPQAGVVEGAQLKREQPLVLVALAAQAWQ